MMPMPILNRNAWLSFNNFLLGWGKIHPRGGITRVLEQAKMPVVSNQVCHKKNFPNNNVPVSTSIVILLRDEVSQK